ncbi:MAG: ATP synthase F1 subunit delta, partial [Balneolaceae bacterium]|nr:ATP synthase F1 subunit delta [Balneolaceae bacterium]
DEVEAILEDIRLIKNTVEGSRELVLFLRSPVVKFDDKVEVLDKLFADKVTEVTIRFIKLLARKKRVYLLDQIAEAFVEQYNRYAGIVKIDVFSARELSESQREALHRALEEKTNKKVEMKVSLDESLKGGIAVRIDDTVIDRTVKHKLEQLEEKLLASETA